MILDWHEDLRTRCSLALLEYMERSEISDSRVLVINFEATDHYIIYSKNKMICFGEFLIGNYGSHRETIFKVEYTDHEDWNARFCKIEFYEVARKYADLAYEGFTVYGLNQQPPEIKWEPDWGIPIIKLEFDLFYAEVDYIKTDGVLCELFDWENNVKITKEYSMFIPFDFTQPVTDSFVGCKVDGTFFLLFNLVELPKISVGCLSQLRSQLE